MWPEALEKRGSVWTWGVGGGIWGEDRLRRAAGLRNSSGEDWILAAPPGDRLHAEMNTPIRWLENPNTLRKSS